MSKSRKGKKHARNGLGGHYSFRLFMAGKGANSRKALDNLRILCEEHLEGRFTIKTIDVVKNFDAAVNDNILVTPALVLVSPHPKVVVLGNLSDTPKVLAALGLPVSKP